MRRLSLAKSQLHEAGFGSEVAERLGLHADDVAAMVGAIVGGAAAAFVVGQFEEGWSLPLMLPRAESIDPTVEGLVSAGATRIIIARTTRASQKDPNAFVFAGVQFSAVHAKDRSEKLLAPG
jgi:hypothetical protein